MQRNVFGPLKLRRKFFGLFVITCRDNWRGCRRPAVLPPTTTSVAHVELLCKDDRVTGGNLEETLIHRGARSLPPRLKLFALTGICAEFPGTQRQIGRASCRERV